jgi:hypothetical protein
MTNGLPISEEWNSEYPTGIEGVSFEKSLPIVRAIVSPSYFVLKAMLMFIEDRMAGSKSLILWETSIMPTPFFLRSLTTLSKKLAASFGTSFDVQRCASSITSLEARKET